MGALLLAFLELTFVMVSILLLHSLKRSIGNPAFYLALGMFFVLGQIISSASIMLNPGFAGFQVDLGTSILLTPYMVAILIVYVIDGTLEAQRMILGLLAVMMGYFYLANITASQCAWGGYTTPNPDAVVYIETLFLQGRRVVMASFLAHAVDLFVLPIVFQMFRNRNCRLFFSVLVTLILVQAVESFIFTLVAPPEFGDWWDQVRMTYLARSFVMVWLSILTSIYLHICTGGGQQKRGAMDIVAAFFGGYGRAQELMRHLREWEGRYSVVIQNSSDLIFIVDKEGTVLNANDAALRGLGYGSAPSACRLLQIVKDDSGAPDAWQRVWEELNRRDADVAPAPLVHREWRAKTATGTTLILDANISRAELREQPVAVIIARDVTERRRLESKRRELEEQLFHAQRLESIGQLAGGIAHDFNNLLHTVHGSLEALEKQRDLTATHRALLGNIGEASTRASALTMQLLGFARKGKYASEKLNLVEVMRNAHALFIPVAPKGVVFKMIAAPTPMFIVGDSTQLQQVFLNLLLNARDAILERGTSGKIVFRAEPAADYTPGWTLKPAQESASGDFVCVRVKDDGVGIPAEIRGSIFDPFFTTKAVGKGTGMGLAMVYGCVGNHNGWIHVESEPGSGTEFFLFLPRA